MGKLIIKYDEENGNDYKISRRDLKRFNTSILNLENGLKESISFEALAVIFDLKNFTSFCDQRDLHLEVPKFLKYFLKWLFQSIINESKKKIYHGEINLYYPFPFFAKFLGDGILFLWKLKNVSDTTRANIIVGSQIICNDYENVFLPKIINEYTNPPPRLRCGIAQGNVTTFGNNDYVGMCINIASRLQKLGSRNFSFAFTKKGLDINSSFHEDWHNHFRLIKIAIRGVNKKELVYVLKKEFRKLPEREQNKLLP